MYTDTLLKLLSAGSAIILLVIVIADVIGYARLPQGEKPSRSNLLRTLLVLGMALLTGYAFVTLLLHR